MWYVEISEDEEIATELPETIGNLLPGVSEILSTLQRQHQEEIAKLHRENVELAGRVGFYQAEIQQLRTQLERAENRILELEAPKEAPAEMSNHPADAQNVADSGSEKLSSRPWWRFWRVNA